MIKQPWQKALEWLDRTLKKENYKVEGDAIFWGIQEKALKLCQKETYKRAIKLVGKRISDKKEGYEIVTTNLNKRLILAQRVVLEQVLNDLNKKLKVIE